MSEYYPPEYVRQLIEERNRLAFEAGTMRAEVAALRDDVGMWRRAHDRVNAEMLSEVQRLQRELREAREELARRPLSEILNTRRELREARALLARWVDGDWQTDEGDWFIEKTRAFLDPRRDEAPRYYTDPVTHGQRACTCESVHEHDPDCPPDCHAEDCPARDEGPRRCKHCDTYHESPAQMEACHAARDEGPRCTCGSPIDGLHDATCALGPCPKCTQAQYGGRLRCYEHARDEARGGEKR